MDFVTRWKLKKTLRRIIRECKPDFSGKLVIRGNDGFIGPDPAYLAIGHKQKTRNWLATLFREAEVILVVETEEPFKVHIRDERIRRAADRELDRFQREAEFYKLAG